MNDINLDTLKLLYDFTGLDLYTKTCKNNNKYLIIKKDTKIERPEMLKSITPRERHAFYGVVIAVYKNSIQLRYINCDFYKKIPGFKKSYTVTFNVNNNKSVVRNEEQLKINE